MELDHIIPRSKRLSDALEATVVTFPSIDREKRSKTALQFIREMNQKENEAKKKRLASAASQTFWILLMVSGPNTIRSNAPSVPACGRLTDEIRCGGEKNF